MRISWTPAVVVACTLIAPGCDWISTSREESPGKTTVSMTFDEAEFQRDQADFRHRMHERMAEMNTRLRRLNEQAKTATEDAKVKLDAEVAAQQKNLEKARGELKEIDAATAEKWADVKQRMAAAFDDLQAGLDSAVSRFR